MRDYAKEVSLGERFEFGQNWTQFIKVLDENRILEAEKSLKEMLKVDDLAGKRFLDIGSGSGLFSLAAKRMGASVHSFDYDPESVECTKTLKKKYFKEDPTWIVERASILDRDHIQSLGVFDIVYSWGVLHHTGAMWQALENVAFAVADQGTLYLSIYNDQLYKSVFWRKVKCFYCSGLFGRFLTLGLFFPYFFLKGLLADFILLKNPARRYLDYRKARGMSKVTDWIDWLGGYPFEVAKPEQIFDFYLNKGYQLHHLKTCGAGLGCNEYVFLKKSSALG